MDITHADKQKSARIQDIEKNGAPWSAAAPTHEKQKPHREPRRVGRLAKSLIGVSAVVLLGWAPATKLLETKSVEAVVNAHLIIARTPIDGEIVAVRARLGSPLGKDAAMIEIVDPRVDMSQVTTLSRRLAYLDSEAIVQAQRTKDLEARREHLLHHGRAFQRGRIEQLDARIGGLVADLARAKAQQEYAELTLQRLHRLKETASASTASVDIAQRDRTVALQTSINVQHRLNEARVELAALKNGVYLSADYNDLPSSLQRAEQILSDISEIEIRRAQITSEREQTANTLAEEKARLDRSRRAVMLAPEAGRPWEIVAAVGETVKKGQELLSFHACANTVVTASVSEQVYNRLAVGDAVSFRLKGGENKLAGTIVQVSGSGGVAGNFAIKPRVTDQTAYHVVIDVPALAQMQDGCLIGRTGRVIFRELSAERLLTFAWRG